MPKLERWIIVAKNVEILDAEDLKKIGSMGAQTGGGWNKIHQHINVNSDNKENVEEYFASRGFEVWHSSDKTFFHPESVEGDFRANASAMEEAQRCSKESWAIGNSFKKLQDDVSDELLSDDLVFLIKDNAEEIARLWLDEVRRNPSTAAYKKLDEDEILHNVQNGVSLFASWLSGDEPEDDIRSFYDSVGKERRASGFKAYEVLSALTFLRKHIWTYARSQGLWERPIEVYRVLELDRRLVLFFDIAMYHTVKAFDTD